MSVAEGLLADTGAAICAIPVAEAFSNLTKEEKLYAHFMCRASFHGTRIVLRQTSEESESIFDLICALYTACEGDWPNLAVKMGILPQDLDYFLEYAAMFLGNLGNYRSTGDEKFIPRIASDILRQLCQVNASTIRLFETAVRGIYATSPSKYGYSAVESCASGYYPGSTKVSQGDIETVQNFLQNNRILPENTRVEKKTLEQGDTSFVVHVASSDPESFSVPQINNNSDGVAVTFEPGDFSGPLTRVVQELELSKNHAATENQKEMITSLVKCFRTGCHEDFKTAQRLWVKDCSPAIETIIGFIETYQDPHGVRGAWEGIIALVNKEQSKKFAVLVGRSSEFISKLPWNGQGVSLDDGQLSFLESTNFVKPDFTSLDTIGFVKSESPAGINLPNFEDICQNEGFKNLEFGNVNMANPSDETIPFIRHEEIDFVRVHRERAFEVLVACHELLGHGSGRLLTENPAGKFNFSVTNPPINPITGSPIESWYKPEETWSSVFGADANAIEECRADGVALILITDEEVLRIFGYTKSSEFLADDIMYAGFLTFIYGTIKGLSRWNPATKKWGQSHRRGKFALLKCLLDADPSLLRICENEDDLEIHLDRTKIKSHAVPALSKFLLRLQVFKSTANSQEGVPYFDNFSQVDAKFAGYREIVLKREPPRIQYVQPNTVLENGEVRLREYPATKEALIQSWVERDV